MSGIRIIVGDSQGVYIPESFVNNWSEGWSAIEPEDVKIIEEGPEADFYWDAWDNILRDAFLVDQNGREWHLYQDGDLFAYCEELMTEEEKDNLFGH
jgi:hypothetical protein